MRIDKKVVYPAQFNSNFIREHPKYEDDLRKLIEKSGVKGKFLGQYKQRLRFLEDNSELCSQHTNWFELLRYAGEELYAMRFKDQKNIRILFAFVDYMQTQYAVLLYPFQEKEKEGKKGSYAAAIQVALERLREIREGLDND